MAQNWQIKEDKMLQKTILWVMLVMVLAFGMTVVGCAPEKEEDDDDYGAARLDNYYPIVGETITATFGPSDNKPEGTLKWRWFRGDTSITGWGDENTYTVGAGDVGKIIRVEVSNNGKKCVNSARTNEVLNTPATATLSISMVASRSYWGNSYDVEVTVTLSDGRWNRDISMLDTLKLFDKLVTFTGTPDLDISYAGGWYRSEVSRNRGLPGIGSSFTVRYWNDFDSVPPINLTATINSAAVAEIKSSTNVYNSLTVGTPSSVSVSQWK